jgi:hypothetical protein
MSTHDAECFRQSHRAQGIQSEPRRLEQLPWPRNLFGELASIAELMAGSAHAGENADVLHMQHSG